MTTSNSIYVTLGITNPASTANFTLKVYTK